MKTETCQKCGKALQIFESKGRRFGRCTACRKLVGLGKAEGTSNVGAGDGNKTGEEKTRKAAQKSGGKKSSAKRKAAAPAASAGKSGSAQPHSDPKPAGRTFGSYVREFFG